MTTTEITTTRNSILPVMTGKFADAEGQPIEGLEDLGQQDIILPSYTIIQLTNKKGLKQYGNFYDNLSKEAIDVVNAAILKIAPSRTLWQEGNSGSPECTSYDGVKGTKYGTCVGCEFNHWPKDETDRHVCKAGYIVLAVDILRDNTVFLFRAMGNSVKPIKVLVSQFVKRKVAPFTQHVKLEAKETTNDKGPFYVLTAEIMGPFAPEKAQEYRDLYLMMKGANIAEVEAPPADAAESSEIPFN